MQDCCSWVWFVAFLPVRHSVLWDNVACLLACIRIWSRCPTAADSPGWRRAGVEAAAPSGALMSDRPTEYLTVLFSKIQLQRPSFQGCAIMAGAEHSSLPQPPIY
jgi:hypothetical protein